MNTVKELRKNNETGRLKRLANLKPARPGERRNPRGRPKGSVSIVAVLRKYLQENPDTIDAIVCKWIGRAKVGSIAHLKEMLDRLDGKPRDRVEGDQKLLIIVEYIVPERPQED